MTDDPSSTSPGEGGGGSVAASPTSAGWVVPVKLSPCPPEGFEMMCALKKDDLAFVTAGKFGLFFLPPGLVQMTIASLHQLGQFVKYYQQGALVKNIEIGVQYLCYLTS